MKRKIIALMLIIALAALAAGGAMGLSATPASAKDYTTIELSGPTTGKVGQTLTYTATLHRCHDTPTERRAAGCDPAEFEPVIFYAWRLKPLDYPYAEYPATSNAQGVATTIMPFALAGEYRVGSNSALGVKAFTVTITEDKQPSTPPGGNSGGSSSGGGSSGDSSSGGGSQATPVSGSGSSPSPTASSNNTAAVLGLEQVSASAGSVSSWMWILALGIIILLAIIVAVLLVTRRHPREEEYVPEDTSDYYRTGRR